jgi:hypothetical protein
VPEGLRRERGRAAFTVSLVALLFLAASAGSAIARPASYPTLPLADDRGFLGNVSAPSLAPGGSGTISFTVGNPLSVPITGTELTLQVYAFNGFPGNATTSVAVAGAPVLSNASSSGGSVGVTVGTVPSAGVFRGAVTVATSGTTPSGTFAIRTALSFVAAATAYRMESRGWFNASVWAAATELPNGSATLNLSVLGVSGVVPETAVVVEQSILPWLLAGVLGVAAVLVGVGAWVYFRRGPASSSGMRKADDDHHAPRAFGNSRTRDGD